MKTKWSQYIYIYKTNKNKERDPRKTRVAMHIDHKRNNCVIKKNKKKNS